MSISGERFSAEARHITPNIHTLCPQCTHKPMNPGRTVTVHCVVTRLVNLPVQLGPDGARAQLSAEAQTHMAVTSLLAHKRQTQTKQPNHKPSEEKH